MENGKKTVDIMVVGDLVQDNNLIQDEESGNTYSEIVTTSVLETNLGGAWYLAEMIHNAGEEFCHDKVIMSPPELESIRKSKSLGQAYQVWSRCEKDVFRISQFLGCPQAEKPFWQPGQKRSAKILVIDDLGMGYLRFNKADDKKTDDKKTDDNKTDDNKTDDKKV
ncbi:MAG: hypothetical protein J7L57_04150, partial [Deltaproteobacteria bacterium]|nr:hypothetical protein [Candidatus Tharpella sp.]